MTRSVFAALVVIASNALFVADALSATAAAKAKRVLVPIADGTEEIEVVTVVDVLRRAGAEVVLASVEDDDRTAVTCSRGVKIEADCHVKAVTGRQGGKEGWDLIAIPGGAPDQRLMQNSVAQWIAYQTSNLGVAGSSPVGVVGCRRHAQFPLAVGHRQGQGLLAGVLSSLPLVGSPPSYPACRQAPPSKLLFQNFDPS